MEKILSQAMKTQTYPVQASVGFYDRVLTAIAQRKETLFVRKLILLWTSMLISLGIAFYFLTEAFSKVLSTDLLEYVDMGVQNPDMLSTTEWQMTVWESVPFVEFSLVVACSIFLSYLFIKARVLFIFHTSPYARTHS